MARNLCALYSGFLHEHEKVQLVVRLVTEVESSTENLIDDDVAKVFNRLKEKLVAYTSTREPISLRNYNLELKEASRARNADLQVLLSTIRSFRNATRELEQAAYMKLLPLYQRYKDIRLSSYEEATAMIRRLLMHLQSSEYHSAVSALSLTRLITYLSESQKKFEKVFAARVKVELLNIKVDIQQLRSNLFSEYTGFCAYVDMLVWAKEQTQHQQLLAIINNGREYFAESVARRRGRRKSLVNSTLTVENRES